MLNIEVIRSTVQDIYYEDYSSYRRISAKENLAHWQKLHPRINIIDIEYKSSFWEGEYFIVKYSEKE